MLEVLDHRLPEDSPMLSLSLIDETHMNTWSPSGLILSVPKENIFVAWHRDLVANIPSPDPESIIRYLNKKFRFFGL